MQVRARPTSGGALGVLAAAILDCRVTNVGVAWPGRTAWLQACFQPPWLLVPAAQDNLLMYAACANTGHEVPPPPLAVPKALGAGGPAGKPLQGKKAGVWWEVRRCRA